MKFVVVRKGADLWFDAKADLSSVLWKVYRENLL